MFEECSCLPCGHIYGLSCIKTWIQRHRSSTKVFFSITNSVFSLFSKVLFEKKSWKMTSNSLTLETCLTQKFVTGKSDLTQKMNHKLTDNIYEGQDIFWMAGRSIAHKIYTLESNLIIKYNNIGKVRGTTRNMEISKEIYWRDPQGVHLAVFRNRWLVVRDTCRILVQLSTASSQRRCRRVIIGNFYPRRYNHDVRKEGLYTGLALFFLWAFLMK